MTEDEGTLFDANMKVRTINSAAQLGATGLWGGESDEIGKYGNVLDQDGVENLAMLQGSTTRRDMAAQCRDGFDMASPVGSYPPNGFGLYDMMGNVWEWVNDWYGEFSSADVTDPTGPETGDSPVYRGGSWSDVKGALRIASRRGDGPPVRSGIGFRLVRGKGSAANSKQQK